MRSFFQVGGALLPTSPCYIERLADGDALRAALNGDYLRIIAPRQLGKTSLLRHLKWRLEDDGWRCVYIDPTYLMNYLKPLWYHQFGLRLAEQLATTDPGLTDQVTLRSYLIDRLNDPSEGKPRIALLLDEVESVCRPYDEQGKPFHEAFFMMLRSLYNERDSYKGTLVVAFAGATNPRHFVRDATISPFNIGANIQLNDLTLAETERLVQLLTHSGLSLEESVPAAFYSWTSGHPYLVERICSELEKEALTNGVTAITHDTLAQAVEQVFFDPFNRDDNIAHVEASVNQLSDIARKLWVRLESGETVSKTGSSDILYELYLTGAVRIQGNRLVLRNRIYEQVFVQTAGPDPPEQAEVIPLTPAAISATPPPSRARTRRTPQKKAQKAPLAPPLDLRIELTPPLEGSPPDVLATMSLSCPDLGLGPFSCAFTDPLQVGEREKLQWYVEEYRKAPADAAFTQLGREVEALLPAIGKRLYQQLVRCHTLVDTWRLHPAEQHQVSIISNLPRLLALPWELLHDDFGYLAVRSRFSLVRRLIQSSLLAFSLPFEPPLRILLVTSRPDDIRFVDPRSIAREVLDAIQHLIDGGAIHEHAITLEFLRPPTLDALRRRLNQAPTIHVLHFDGHGAFDEQSGRGVLYFEDEEGRGIQVASDNLANVLSGSVQLLILTACKSDVGSVDDPFSGMATRLIQGGINAVVSMGATVLVSTAKRYVEEFYRMLFASYSVLTAQEQARQALYTNTPRSPAPRQKAEGDASPSPTAVRRNIEPSDRASSCLNQCIEVAMGSIIPNTAVDFPHVQQHHVSNGKQTGASRSWIGGFPTIISNVPWSCKPRSQYREEKNRSLCLVYTAFHQKGAMVLVDVPASCTSWNAGCYRANWSW